MRTRQSRLLMETLRVPKFNKDNVPCLLPDHLINDSWEVECQECDETLEVEGLTEDVEYTTDHFNGSHFQTEEYGREFSSEFICPKCQHHNKIEGKQI